MTIGENQSNMMAQGEFGLSEPTNRFFGGLLTNIENGSFRGDTLNLANIALTANALECLDHALQCNPLIAENIKELVLNIDSWFPFGMPSFSSLKNLESLDVHGPRCMPCFKPLQFPNLVKFSLHSTCNIEEFPDLRACQKLQSITVKCYDVRYVNEFKIPGLDDARQVGFSTFKDLFPELVEFEFSQNGSRHWQTYAECFSSSPSRHPEVAERARTTQSLKI